jgi:hypothetical protein
MDEDGGMTRSPTMLIHLAPDRKSADGDTLGGAEAKLLEMNGSGTEAGLKLIDRLRNMALEQIQASRKDPEKLRAPLSGRAMEYMDEDSDDLIMELRSQYGQAGALPLIRKIVAASPTLGKLGIVPQEIDLAWPRLFQPTPQDLGQLIPALVQAVTPVPLPMPNPPTAQPAGDGEGGARAAPKQQPATGEGLLPIDKVRAYLELNMDLSIFGTTDDADDDEDEAETQTTGATEDIAPPPVEPAAPSQQVEKAGPYFNIYPRIEQ